MMIPLELPPDFPHEPPEGYSYQVKPFKRNVVAIWLQHPDHFNFTSDRVSTIWGFMNKIRGKFQRDHHQFAEIRSLDTW